MARPRVVVLKREGCCTETEDCCTETEGYLNRVISVSLDLAEYEELRNPRNLSAYVKSRLLDDGKGFLDHRRTLFRP